MKKLISMMAVIAFLFAGTVNAQQKQEAKKETAKTEKKESAKAEKKESAKAEKKEAKAEKKAAK